MAWKTKIPYRLIDFSARIHPSDNYVIGVKRISDSGGAGTWVRIDENDNVVEVQPNYFANHPSYQLKDMQIPFGEGENDYNEFVEIPKFYVKSDGNTRFWISPTAKDGFHCHPAFMSYGKEIDCIYVGKYQGYMYENKMYSIPQNIFIPQEDPETGQENNLEIRPTVYITFDQCKNACEKWNTSSEEGAIQVQGYHMFNIHELAAIQWLALIEIATTNAAMPVSDGGYGEGRLYGTGLDTVNGQGTSDSNFHGIVGLWGNIWEFIEGIKVMPDNTIAVWDNEGYRTSDGERAWKYTKNTIPFKKKELEVWGPGETCGYYKNRLLDAGSGSYVTTSLNLSGYDTSDLFIPDFTTLTPYYETGSYSDGLFTRVKSTFETNVAIGGGFDTGDYGGLYSYRFDLQHPKVTISSEGIINDNGDNAGDIGTRLCWAKINIA